MSEQTNWWLVASFGPGANVIDACWVEAATDVEAAEEGRALLKGESNDDDQDYCETVAVLDARAPRWFAFEAKAVHAELPECVCVCGHPFDAHGHVEGRDLSDGSRLADVWVCGGGRLADVNSPGWSPWDHVCGCVLHEEPRAGGGRL